MRPSCLVLIQSEGAAHIHLRKRLTTELERQKRMKEALSVERVHAAMDAVLAQCNTIAVDDCENPKNIRFRRVKNEADWDKVRQAASSSSLSMCKNDSIPYFFGLRASMDVSGLQSGADVGDAAANATSAYCTFYLSYSTWDGRMIYVDRMILQRQISKSPNQLVAIAMYRALAKVAIALDCARLSWTQNDPPTLWPNPAPEFCKEWLFLNMDRSAMEQFVLGRSQSEGSSIDTTESSRATATSTSTATTFERHVVERVIHGSLKEGAEQSDDSKLALRLASGKDDMDEIARLVKCLAIYEKEPDAVNATAKDYLMDGGGSEEPLFYCLLADTTIQKEESATERVTCGMGFIFFGYKCGEGPFIYLEDLYVDEAYRGLGGGKMMMKELARIALKLGCIQLSWSALDWNTPALNFYEKIGAKLQQDMKLTRYCNEELVSFAQGTG